MQRDKKIFVNLINLLQASDIKSYYENKSIIFYDNYTKSNTIAPIIENNRIFVILNKKKHDDIKLSEDYLIKDEKEGQKIDWNSIYEVREEELKYIKNSLKPTQYFLYKKLGLPAKYIKDITFQIEDTPYKIDFKKGFNIIKYFSSGNYHLDKIGHLINKFDIRKSILLFDNV